MQRLSFWSGFWEATQSMQGYTTAVGRTIPAAVAWLSAVSENTNRKRRWFLKPPQVMLL